MSNVTYLCLLTALCQKWALRILTIEEELELEVEHLALVSKLFIRTAINSNQQQIEEENYVIENALTKKDNTLLELSKLLQIMLKKNQSTVVNKSFNEITKLVINVSRKIKLKRESEVFSVSQVQHQQQFCPICKSLFEGSPSQWYLDGTAKCQNKEKGHIFTFDYSTRALKTHFNIFD